MKKKYNPLIAIQKPRIIRSYYMPIIKMLFHALFQERKIMSFQYCNESGRCYGLRNNEDAVEDTSAFFFHVQMKHKDLLFKFTPSVTVDFAKRRIKERPYFVEIIVSSLPPFDTKEIIFKLIEEVIEKRLWGKNRENRALRLWKKLWHGELKDFIGEPYMASEYNDLTNGVDVFIPIKENNNGHVHYVDKMKFNAKSNMRELMRHKRKRPDVTAACIKTRALSREAGDEIIMQKLKRIFFAYYYKGEVLCLE